MNNQRRNLLKKAIKKIRIGIDLYSELQPDTIVDLLEDAQGIVEDVLDDEEISFDSIPENLQDSEMAYRSEECIDLMNDALDELQQAIDTFIELEENDEDCFELLESCIEAIELVIDA